jgi:predicted NACHT family NTPase
VTAKVFLAHSKEDRAAVEDTYRRLQSVGISAWLDSHDLAPAQVWTFEIKGILATVPAVVVFLSTKSLTEAGSFRNDHGYFQEEIALALEESRKWPTATPFILPLRLDDCAIPTRLRGFHWLDYFESDGFEKLVQFLRRRFVSITDSSSTIRPAEQEQPSTEPRILMGHQERVYAVPFNKSGSLLASASYDRLVKLWNVAEGREYMTFSGHEEMVFWVAFSPDGLWLASASRDHTAKLWHIESAQVTTLRGHKLWVKSVEFSPDGRWVATGSDDKTVRLWSRKTFRSRVLRGHSAPVKSVAFSPIGRNLASGGTDSVIKLWRSYSDKDVATFRGHSDGVTCVVFNQDGRRLASSSGDGTARIWDVETGDIYKTCEAKSQVNSVAFSPDGDFLAGACFDGTVKIWDVATEKVVRVLEGHERRVFNATFSPNGHLLASAGEDRTIRLWHWRAGLELAAKVN